MKEKLFVMLVQTMLTFLNEDMIKSGIDALLDVCEDAIEKSETKVDDKILLPIIEQVRNTLNIPDND